jgi:hypothetical protein
VAEIGKSENCRNCVMGSFGFGKRTFCKARGILRAGCNRENCLTMFVMTLFAVKISYLVNR